MHFCQMHFCYFFILDFSIFRISKARLLCHNRSVIFLIGRFRCIFLICFSLSLKCVECTKSSAVDFLGWIASVLILKYKRGWVNKSLYALPLVLFWCILTFSLTIFFIFRFYFLVIPRFHDLITLFEFKICRDSFHFPNCL